VAREYAGLRTSEELPPLEFNFDLDLLLSAALHMRRLKVLPSYAEMLALDLRWQADVYRMDDWLIFELGTAPEAR